MKIPKEIRDKEGVGTTRGKMCSIIGCENGAIRNLPEKEYENYVLKAGLKYIKNRIKMIYLCNNHLKLVKKEKRNDKKPKKKGFLVDSPKPYKYNNW